MCTFNSQSRSDANFSPAKSAGPMSADVCGQFIRKFLGMIQDNLPGPSEKSGHPLLFAS